MSAGAAAVAVGSDVAVSATARASAFDTFDSAGVPRAGLIQFNVTLSHLHGGNSDALLTDGIHTYGYAAPGGGSTPPFGLCSDEGCQWTATVPFDLGTAFRVTADANDVESVMAGNILIDHGDVNSVVVFRLLEADGTTPVAFSAVPEPSTFGLLLIGFCASGWLVLHRNARSR